MLILCRKKGERIRIGKDIWIMLVEVVSGGKARIGISAPDEVEIVREELLEFRQPSETKEPQP